MSIRNIPLLMILSLLFLPAWCAAGKAPDGPVAFLPETSFEFPPRVEGGRVVHDFIIQNHGSAPLEILKIKSG